MRSTVGRSNRSQALIAESAGPRRRPPPSPIVQRDANGSARSERWAAASSLPRSERSSARRSALRSSRSAPLLAPEGDAASASGRTTSPGPTRLERLRAEHAAKVAQAEADKPKVPTPMAQKVDHVQPVAMKTKTRSKSGVPLVHYKAHPFLRESRADLLRIKDQLASFTGTKFKSVKELFGALDVDGDGVISMDDWLTGLKTLNFPINEDEARRMFIAVDADSSNGLDYGEVVSVLEPPSVTSFLQIRDDQWEDIKGFTRFHPKQVELFEKLPPQRKAIAGRGVEGEASDSEWSTDSEQGVPEDYEEVRRKRDAVRRKRHYADKATKAIAKKGALNKHKLWELQVRIEEKLAEQGGSPSIRFLKLFHQADKYGYGYLTKKSFRRLLGPDGMNLPLNDEEIDLMVDSIADDTGSLEPRDFLLFMSTSFQPPVDAIDASRQRTMESLQKNIARGGVTWRTHQDSTRSGSVVTRASNRSFDERGSAKASSKREMMFNATATGASHDGGSIATSRSRASTRLSTARSRRSTGPEISTGRLSTADSRAGYRAALDTLPELGASSPDPLPASRAGIGAKLLGSARGALTSAAANVLETISDPLHGAPPAEKIVPPSGLHVTDHVTPARDSALFGGPDVRFDKHGRDKVSQTGKLELMRRRAANGRRRQRELQWLEDTRAADRKRLEEKQILRTSHKSAQQLRYMEKIVASTYNIGGKSEKRHFADKGGANGAQLDAQRENVVLHSRVKWTLGYQALVPTRPWQSH